MLVVDAQPVCSPYLISQVAVWQSQGSIAHCPLTPRLPQTPSLPKSVDKACCFAMISICAAGLRDTSSSISVTATLENAQRIVSKIPETAANEEDIAPLLQEFEDLTAQLQAELDKLSAVTNHLSPSRL